MLFPQQLLPNRQGSLMIGSRANKVSLDLPRIAYIVEAFGCIKMVFSKQFLPDN
jgi:hypothetical protein